MARQSNLRPARALPEAGLSVPHPRYAVWELTLACNLKCRHCGSRAGTARPDELTTDEALRLVKDLAEAGTKEVTLIGGEAYIRRDWLKIVSAIAEAGMLCTLQTGGRALTRDRLSAAKAAGLAGVGVSVDGLAATHDDLRGVRGSHMQALGVLSSARELGLVATANTQINRRNLAEIEAVFDDLVHAGARAWTVQLTVPMGNAADLPELLLQPWELLDLMPRLYAMFERGLTQGLRLIPGNNIGYFGPYEAAWRSITGAAEHYGGCMAGRAGLGIEANGDLKGCPSLPSTPYVGGNVRDAGFSRIWESSEAIGFMRDEKIVRDRLWGFCGTCRYGSVCRAGCTWTTHVLTGRPGNNPYCHYRVLKLAGMGLRETIEQREAPAEPMPFDYGRFEITVEDQFGGRFDQEIFRTALFAERPIQSDQPLVLCSSCDEFHSVAEATCPFCAGAAATGASSHSPPGLVAARVRNALMEMVRRSSSLARSLEAIGSTDPLSAAGMQQPVPRPWRDEKEETGIEEIPTATLRNNIALGSPYR